MARRKAKSKPAFEVFNVVYMDGSLSSNRRVSSKFLDDRFGEDPIDLARRAIEEQDQAIAVKSGVAKSKIKSITRPKQIRLK